MRSTKSIILIVIALGCGLIASIGISQVMEKKDPNTPAEMETIYVAVSSVPSWKPLNAELVKEEEWPVDKVPEGAARSLDELVGKSPRYPLYSGEPIILSKLSDSDGSSASIRIPEGHQVMSVKVDKESALSGLINPGDKVDVLVFIRGRSQENIRTGTRTIMRNTTVFAVNDQMARNTDEESSIDAKTVSLLVRPEQSEKLLLAKQLGTIHLALRKPGDESNVETDGALPGDLDESSEGSDGMLASRGDSKPKGGIFELLKDMKNASSTAVDSSNATKVPSPSTFSTVIMSPDGIIGNFTFASTSGGRGGLPALPTELMGGFGGEAGGNSANLEPESAEAASSDGDGEDSTPDVDADTSVDVLDAADLGL